MTSLFGKTALVTDGSRGTGRASALALAKAGAQVLVQHCGDKREANAVVGKMRKSGGRAGAVDIDLSTPTGPYELARYARTIIGDRLDILVANTSTSNLFTLKESTVEYFDKLIAVNVRAPCFLIQQLLPAMCKGSNIIFVYSLPAYSSPEQTPALAATEGAVRTIVTHFATELEGRGIRVNAVTPWMMAAEAPPHLAQEEAGDQSTLVGKTLTHLIKSEDVAGAVTFLASDDARLITGSTVQVGD